ncbi:MAG TPA: cupredoxin family copper-binding protein [Gemmatimonadota bacterium]|nr:cupredoxin family copper-binding protein [Gemmatimonadota bacterium]
MKRRLPITPRARCWGLVLILLIWAEANAPASAQSLVDRTPNFGGVDLPPPRTAHFAFLHRFELVGEETKKVLNYPTFLLGVGLPGASAVGIHYASNSELGAGTPNEWEISVRRRFGAALAATIAYNTAAASLDGELAGRLRIRRISLHGVARAFSDAFGSEGGQAALGAGVMLHLTPRLAVGGDVARVVTVDSLPAAWSAGVHMVIPGSPHTLGFAVSNVGATTLEGASRGAEDADGDENLRYGFAFTMPLGTLSQWARIFRGEEPAPGGAERARGEEFVSIRDFIFGPAEIRIVAGETVRWVNDDGVAHTVTADEGSFDSGLIQPGEGYSRRFEAPGRYPYHCVPHPFMKAVVVVEPTG